MVNSIHIPKVSLNVPSIVFLLTWVPVLHGQAVDFSRFVVAGDSLSAGYQNSQLIESGQVHGYANVIATQARTDLQLPLLPAPGYPQVTIQGGFAAVTGINPVSRLNYQPTLDVAVPGFTLG